MSECPVVVVGASAGGMEPLRQLAAALPPDFPGAVFVVLHLPPNSPSRLPQILSQAGPLPAHHPGDGEPIGPGRVYVAPPDHHLLLEGDRVGVKNGPRENRFRPSVDALFRSAAYTHGAGVIGVILSGALDDGTSGLWTIKRLGGVAAVQDPGEAQFDGMPRSALEHVAVDHVVPASELGPLLTRLVRGRAAPPQEVVMNDEERRRLEVEVQIAAGAQPLALGLTDLAEPSPFTCPECHGVLYALGGDPVTRFRCHTGHAYTLDALLSETSSVIEAKLYQTLRALEEGILLLRRLSRRAGEQGAPGDAARLLAKAGELEEQTRVIQRITLRHPVIGLPGDG